MDCPRRGFARCTSTATTTARKQPDTTARGLRHQDERQIAFDAARQKPVTRATAGCDDPINASPLASTKAPE